MAPKSTTPAAKQQKILEFFQNTMQVYSLKELEKLLPGVAGIHAMQVKENIQSLTDEYQLRVEKIGSGNWYWSFKSDSKKSKETQLTNLRNEEAKLVQGIKDMEVQMEQEVMKREDGDGGEGGVSRKALLEMQEALLREKEGLDKGLACYCDNDPEEVLRKVEETKRLKASAMVLTDNLETLGDVLLGLTQGDRVTMGNAMSQACGDEYVPGEGLKELEN